MDHHHLHAIELVSSIEENGVISNKSNGIKHNEYWVMTPGLLEGATIIDKLTPDNTDDSLAEEEIDPLTEHIASPKVGDVYQNNAADPVIQTMVIAIQGRTVYLGNNFKVPIEEITDTDKWSFIINIRDQ